MSVHFVIRALGAPPSVDRLLSLEHTAHRDVLLRHARRKLHAARLVADAVENPGPGRTPHASPLRQASAPPRQADGAFEGESFVSCREEEASCRAEAEEAPGEAGEAAAAGSLGATDRE